VNDPAPLRVLSPEDADRPDWSREVLSGLIVLLVALPLCLGIAVASGVPPVRGLVSGILGGVLIGALAGSPLLVSGPAAALAVMVAEIVRVHGLAALGPAVLVAGLTQLGAAGLGVGRWFRAVSPAVLHGLLSGIGLTIVVSQVHIMADRTPPGAGLVDLLTLPEAVGPAFQGGPGSQALAIGLCTLASIAAWKKLAPTRLELVPPPLIGALVGTTLALGMRAEVATVQLPGNLLAEIEWFGGGVVGMLLDPGILGAGLALALVASAETLLCAAALDQLHDGPPTAYDRELLAQGVGNVACGLVGALPSVGLIVRSTASVEAGARTRWPAILHGLGLLVLALLFPGVLRLVPVSVLAAVLIYVGWLLIAKAPLDRLRDAGRDEVAIYLVTVAVVFGRSLLAGVALGLVLSLVKLLYSLLHLELRQVVDAEARRVDLHLIGAATFLGLPELAATLEELPRNLEVHVHVDELEYVDHACLELLAGFEERHPGGVVVEWHELTHRAQPRRRAAS